MDQKPILFKAILSEKIIDSVYVSVITVILMIQIHWLDILYKHTLVLLKKYVAQSIHK